MCLSVEVVQSLDAGLQDFFHNRNKTQSVLGGGRERSIIHVCGYMYENRNHILGYTQFNQRAKDAAVHAQHKAEACVIHCLKLCFLFCLATCQYLCPASELKMNKEWI